MKMDRSDVEYEGVDKIHFFWKELMAIACECDKEQPSSIKGEAFLHRLSDC
jgi:hypothetical protein